MEELRLTRRGPEHFSTQTGEYDEGNCDDYEDNFDDDAARIGEFMTLLLFLMMMMKMLTMLMIMRMKMIAWLHGIHIGQAGQVVPPVRDLLTGHHSFSSSSSYTLLIVILTYTLYFTDYFWEFLSSGDSFRLFLHSALICITMPKMMVTKTRGANEAHLVTIQVFLRPIHRTGAEKGSENQTMAG